MSDWTSNDWTQGPSPLDLARADIGLTANVVIPSRNPGPRIDAVLAALALQTYPAELITVTVVDDGSEPPVHLRLETTLDIEVLRIGPEASRGLSAARAAGAAETTADVVIFLDSDMLPEAQWLEAHMRWHATRRNAVVVGFRKHVAATSVDATAVASASSIAVLFNGEEVHVPRWVDNDWARMRDGLAQTERLWRVASGGNISISSALYRRAGGYDPDYWNEWGGEDNEIAYRLYVLGGLFIPERDAMAWHLGVGTSQGPEAQQRGERSRLRLASRIPSPTLQRPKHLVPEVPEVCVELDITGETAEEVVLAVDSILGALGNRVRIVVRLLTSHADLSLMRLLLDHDARVLIRTENEPVPTRWQHASISASSAPIDWSEIELAKLVSVLDTTGSVDIIGEQGPVAKFWWTRLPNTRPDLDLEDALSQYPRRLTSLSEWARAESKPPTA